MEADKTLSDDEHICYETGYHEWEAFIDPRSGGFVRCRICGISRDCEDPMEIWDERDA